jgi:ribosomal-protein-alanine N-acetyltransferase
VTVIATPRLLLRELTAEDAACILELLNEADFLRFIGDKGVRNLSDAREYISKGPLASYQRHGFGLYAACLRDGTWLGMCGLVKREGLDEPDLGFAFLERYRGQGYALEAARSVLEQARQELAIARILAITSTDNQRSGAVLEKAGFKFTGRITLGESPEEINLYSNDPPGAAA